MDKILFLVHEQVSHAFDTFFDGCIEYFGFENVFEYPCVSKYHSNYTSHGHSYAWWCFNDLKHITSLNLETWANEINNGNIKYIIASNRGSGIENLKLLIPMLYEETFKKICIIFLEEEEDPGFEVHRWCIEHLKSVYHKIDIHYKVDFIRSKIASYDKIYPFYLSAPMSKILSEIKQVKNFSDRKYDVCYIVGASHKNRLEYFKLLQNLKIGNNIITYGTHNYNLTEYFNAINNSKIFISVRGNGYSNTRNVEGPICGAALFTEKLEIEIPNDYKDKKSAIFFDQNNLIETINYYLNNQKELKTLAFNSNKYCIEYHSSFARAKSMVFLAKKLKGI